MGLVPWNPQCTVLPCSVPSACGNMISYSSSWFWSVTSWCDCF
jgi:hypothetical protein